ncbi:MAG: hypothetical protein IKT14_05145 [Clostridiales bacterium]|nr:hypothetical protein [Clostridiales bacterium]
MDYTDRDELYKDMKALPGIKGEISKEGEDAIFWKLPNGIIIELYLNSNMNEWYFATAYEKDGKNIPLTHWHPDCDEVFEDIMDICEGGTFWAVKTDMFGKEKPPYIFEQKEFDKLSDKEKSKYRILE